MYKAANLPMHISNNLLAQYQAGTKPTGPVTANEIAELQNLLSSHVAQTTAHLQQGLFTNYSENTLPTGFNLSNISDALAFNNYHEGLHLGYMMSISKLI